MEDVVRVLAGLREPLVISANSTRGLRVTAMGLPRIGELLGAHYLVSGSVRLVGDAARISVELAEATTGAVLWASAYDCPGSGQLDAQERIAGGIANALVPQVGAAELRRNRVARQDAPGAYHVLLRARDLIFTLERPAFEGAAALLRKAIALDPEYSPAYATMADWHSLRLFQGWSDDPEADLAGIEGSAQTAIRLDPNNARALAILGHNRMLSARDYEGAMDLFDKALAAAPNDAEAWMWSSPTYAYAGTPAEAIARAERALALSPCDPLLFRYEHFLCIAHYAAGDLEAAVHWGQRSLASNPNYTSNLRMTVASLAGLGRAPEAAPLVRRAMRVEPNFRVQSMIARQAFRDEAARHRYGERLLAAGFPR